MKQLKEKLNLLAARAQTACDIKQLEEVKEELEDLQPEIERVIALNREAIIKLVNNKQDQILRRRIQSKIDDVLLRSRIARNLIITRRAALSR